MDNRTYREQLLARTKKFSVDIVRFIDGFSRRELSLQIILHQLIRSATSIGANVAEAQAASSRKDFTNFISHALKSANETKYWLELLLDSGKGERSTLARLLREAHELSNLLGSSILALRNKK